MHKIVKMYQFKHLLCYLCSIVNKIFAHVIWNSFSFHFIKILKNVPRFPEFGLYKSDLLTELNIQCKQWSLNNKKNSHMFTYRGKHANVLWMCCVVMLQQSGWGGEELLNKVVIFVFFVHKKYSGSFVKLRLNHWCHMDYFTIFYDYFDVLTTFLYLELLLSMEGQKALGFLSKIS